MPPMPTGAPTPRPALRTRLHAYGEAGLVLALLLWPLNWQEGEDSFPLSPFPMFASGRHEPVLDVHHALRVLPDGTRQPLPPRLTGNGTVMQSAATLQRVVHDQRAAEFCRALADRLAERRIAAEAVEIATSRFDVVRYFLQDPTPLSRQVHARCRIHHTAATYPPESSSP